VKPVTVIQPGILGWLVDASCYGVIVFGEGTSDKRTPFPKQNV
jgi:hypothetical protein